MSGASAVLEAPSPPKVAHWLPAGKTAAICFSVDDIHPATSRDAYEAGGDLEAGAMGRLLRLQRRHRHLKATLCVTPDWRLDSLVADGVLLRHIPWINRLVHHSRLQPPGRFRLDRHPEFVAFLNGLERCEIVPHGLHHAHVGPRRAVEFQDQEEEHCAAIVQRGLEIFALAKLRFVRGYVPPAWNAPPALIAALSRLGFQFITSARDLRTAVSPAALTAMNGLNGVSLIHPQTVGSGRLVHLPCNFQATSAVERAVEILEMGGLLHIKAHIFKTDGRHVMADGLDELYCNYLDLLFTVLERRFAGQLWWAHLSEVAERFRAQP
ncbi:MAG TPA: DUF2334 domain-containing protein [Steroidobacteraceae bacterium]|jgi:hypothetical protein|nr:DUF2334 domain-containing protein [Steroidobacteraceae bacterium]